MKHKQEENCEPPGRSIIKKPNAYIVLSISFLIVLVIGFADYITGYEIALSIFYLAPISIAVYFSGFRSAFVISVCSAMIWYLADIHSGHVYQHPLIPVWNTLIGFGYYILHSFFFSKFIVLYNEAKFNSLTDQLTKAVNSQFFCELFERELKRSQRSNSNYTLVYLDLDDFKLMNDTHGHSAGDSLFMTISKLIKNNIRRSDIFARMGGDEFALLFPETDFHESASMIKRIKEAVDNEMMANNWPVSMSIGAITFKKFEASINEMIKQADILMYEVKRKGKNNIEHRVVE